MSWMSWASSNRKMPPAPTATPLPSKISPGLRTLILKEHLLSDHLEVTDELLQSLHDAGLAKSVNQQIMQANRNNSVKKTGEKSKVKILLEGLKTNWSSDDDLEKLSNVLERLNPWLSDEIRMELAAELGEQVTSEALDLENGRIVFKEFGTEKRLSELEKKRLHKLLNRKTQTTRNTWEQQLNRLLQEVQEATDTNEAIEAEATSLVKDIHEYLNHHAAAQFQNRAIIPTVRSTTELFTKVPALQKLETYTNGLIQLAGQTRMEAENMVDEKAILAKRINQPTKRGQLLPSPFEGSIDIQLKRYIDEKKKSISDSKEAIIQQEQLSLQLVEEIAAAEDAMKKSFALRQRTIDDLVAKTKIKGTENENMERYIDQLRQELAASEDQLNRLSSRTHELEKGRRVQQIFGTAPTNIKQVIIDHLGITAQLPPPSSPPTAAAATVRFSDQKASAFLTKSSSSSTKKQQLISRGSADEEPWPKLTNGSSLPKKGIQ